MKTKLFIIAGILLLATSAFRVEAARRIVHPQRVSVGDSLYVMALKHRLPPEKYVWNWRDAVLLKSFIDIYRVDESKRDEIADYIVQAMTRLAPKAHGRHPNGVASACGLAFLKEIGRNTPETDAALERVYKHYKEIPRAANGGCSHRPGRVELWDDTIYMLDLLLIGCYWSSGDIAYVQEFADQMIAHAEHLQDPKTGLWYHGWSESGEAYDDKCCQKGWNGNPEHRSSEFWGRGNGWVAMALADLLEVLPKDDPRYPKVESMFQKMAATLIKRQVAHDGLWCQLPIRMPVGKNFTESSCSAMFGYALAKGANIGVLSPGATYAAIQAAMAIDRYCIEGNSAMDFRLGKICEGTCIGDKQYYLSRKQVYDDTYAIGATLMLYNELHKTKL
ncbi:MAG: glycoside hydrolase family 88 protein [Bacteroidales bacterium]|nr:glycoside hydrolase family 88 protein [Bacteroidales bacterium]